MSISAAQVKELRERTGVGIMDCKEALQEADGDVEEAVKVLRKMGKAKAAKKASREASEGRVDTYVHTGGKMAGGKMAVLVEVNCETDFVARSDEFTELIHNLAMHIAASNPIAIRREDVDEELVESEKEVYRSQAEAEGKPPEIAEKIVEGKINRWLSESVLYEQPFVRDPDRTVSDVITDAINRIGERIVVRRFVRMALGEDEGRIVTSSA